MPQPVSAHPAAFKDLIDTWFPLTYVPFVPSPAAVAKLKFVDDVVGCAKGG